MMVYISTFIFPLFATVATAMKKTQLLNNLQKRCSQGGVLLRSAELDSPFAGQKLISGTICKPTNLKGHDGLT